jgi:dGTPase
VARPPGATAGREARRPPEPAPKSRTEGQRDRDRVLYSDAFARLDAVTQVSLASEGALFHNRLTHSLKVAQIGRRLAERFQAEANRDRVIASTVEQLGGLDPDVVEAACLAHDLGHPPFGHVGEEELNKWVSGKGLADGFEGNAQSFRIITRLAYATEEAGGLNPTAATLNAVLKYPWSRREGIPKWGYYESERDQFEWAREQLGLIQDVRSLEARLMDWADDVTYAIHDVEDFFKAGLIPLNALSEAIRQDPDSIPPDWDPILRRVEANWSPSPEYPRYDPDKALIAARGLANFPLTGSFGGTRSDRTALLDWSSVQIGQLIDGTSIGQEDLIIRDEARFRVEVLKALTKEFVIFGPALATQQVGERRIIKNLLRTLWGCLQDGTTHVLPPRVQQEAEDVAVDDRDAQVRLIADTVAQMTEFEALRLHQRFSGVGLGSVTEPTAL